MIKGVYTAAVTPFGSDGKIDFPALGGFLDAQIAAGVDGLVLLGTTAETATLSAREKEELLHFAVKRINKRVKIIIGTGANSTAQTVENTKAALPYAPEAALVVTPYYNKPNPNGLIAHYKEVAKAGLPIVLYHIPGRTGLKVPMNVMSKLLAEVPEIIGVKESDYDMAHVTDMAVRYSNKISYLCGNDDLFPEYLAVNSAGIVSAAANVFAPAFVSIYKDFKAGDTHGAFQTFAKLYPFIKACYLETNPTCIKYMLSRLGVCGGALRLPLAEIDDATKAKIDALLENADQNLFIQH